MQTVVKSFDQLSREELYQLLQLRCAVFIVEQDCAYQDVDGKDNEGLHIMGYEDGRLVAYTRVFPPGVYDDTARIGRVVVHSAHRGKGLGVDIMQATMSTVMEHFNTSRMSLSAQTYLTKFYTDLGFIAVGEEYLEDDIPHILMISSA